MVHSVVGNDVNIQLRREINQSVGQRCLVEPGAGRKSAAAQHDFCDPGQMGKFGNLIGYIVAIYGFDGCAQLLCQMDIGPKALFVRRRHPLEVFRFHKQCG